MKSTLIISILVLISNISFASPAEVLTACKSLVEHASKVELGEEYEILKSTVSLYNKQSEFELKDNQARARAIVSPMDDVYYEYAFTVTYSSDPYLCSLSDIDSIPNGF